MKKAAFLVLAVLTLTLAAVAQNAPPKENTKSAAHTDNGQDKPPNQPPTAQSEYCVETQCPTAEEKDSRHHKDAAEPDWWSRIENGLMAFGTLALAVIGFIAACAAIKTLRMLARQTVANVLAAKAAKANIDALINSERAWVEGELVEDEEAKKVSVVRHVLKLKNFGRTPAHLLSYEIEIKPSGPSQMLDVVSYSGSRTVTLNRFLGSGATDYFDRFNLKDDFGHGCETGTLYFVIKYEDMLGEREDHRERHQTSFLYYYTVLLETLDRVNTFGKYT
jgi:hypothetical protein